MLSASMPSLTDKLVAKSERWREVVLGPLLSFLQRIGVSANAISCVRLALALCFPFLIISAPVLAWWAIAIAIAADGLDGALARHAGTESDRGKFVDVLADQLTFVVLCLGLLRLIPELALTLAVCATLIPTAYLMAMVSRNEKLKSDWLIHPEARLTGYKIVFLIIIIFLLNSIFSMEIAVALLWVLVVLAFLHFSYHLIAFIKRHPA